MRIAEEPVNWAGTLKAGAAIREFVNGLLLDKESLRAWQNISDPASGYVLSGFLLPFSDRLCWEARNGAPCEKEMAA